MRPSRWRIERGVLALAPALLGGCFDFDATMAGGPPGDSGSEAGPDATDAGGSPAEPGDAIADAQGGGPSDADADGAVDAGRAFCASLARPDGGLFFCDDFDEHALPGSWQYYGETAGTLLETDAAARSAPRSAEETTMPLTSGEPIDVALRTPLPVPALPATLTFAFSLEPLQIDPTAGAAIVLGAVDFLDSAGYRYTVGLAINVASGQPALALGEQSGLADGGSFPDGAPPTFVNHPLPPTLTLPTNAWTDLAIEIDWTTTTLEGKVRVNGATQLDVPLDMSVQPTSIQIGIGTSYVTEYATGTSPVWALRYDNVVFTGQ